MVAQCLERQPSGWRQFVREYLPFAGALLERHFPQLASRHDELLRDLVLRAAGQDAQFFREYSGRSEREFLLHLREHAIRLGEELQPAPPNPEIPLESEVFEKALVGLSPLERQVVWMFVLSPVSGDADQILRLDRKAVAATMAKAQESLRAACDRWNPPMLAENRGPLAREARARRTNDCAAPKVFLRLLDGQITWRDRADLEHQLAACWHCVDLLCRFRETMFLTRRIQPLPESDTEAYLKLLNLEPPRVSPWKRLLGKP